MVINDSENTVIDESGLFNTSIVLPQYINSCKFLLIEELALEDDYRELHYGKCCVIGKTKLCENTGSWTLENIEVPNLPGEYLLPDSVLFLTLLVEDSMKLELMPEQFYEVVGEVILLNINSNDNAENNLAAVITTRTIIEQMQTVNNSDEQEKLLNYFRKHYKPAIRVWFATSIDNAAELIASNLEIRILEKIIKS